MKEFRLGRLAVLGAAVALAVPAAAPPTKSRSGTRSRSTPSTRSRRSARRRPREASSWRWCRALSMEQSTPSTDMGDRISSTDASRWRRATPPLRLPPSGCSIHSSRRSTPRCRPRTTFRSRGCRPARSRKPASTSARRRPVRYSPRATMAGPSGPALRACGSHWPVRRELRCAIRARGSGMQFRSWSRARRSSAPRARCHSRVPPTRPSFNEVKAIGSLNSATRIAAQSHAAAFWQTNPAATTTPSLAGSSTTSRLTRATARACSRCST